MESGKKRSEGKLSTLSLARPAPLLSAAPCSPSDRRDRSPMVPNALHNRVPVFERNDDPSHHPATPRPGDLVARTERLAQVVHLAATGVWVIKRNGMLLEIDGRMHWEDQKALALAADRAGVALSSIVVRTGAA